LRRQRPRTMGSLYWQLNDCWPVASWASIDYYGRWKALHYYARRFYDDVLVSPFLHDDKVDVYVVSDKLAAPLGNDSHAPARFLGKLSARAERKDVQIPAQSKRSISASTRSRSGGKGDLRSFLVFDLEVAGNRVSRNLVFFDVTHNLESAGCAQD
jgi:beta-mannosidase